MRAQALLSETKLRSLIPTSGAFILGLLSCFLFPLPAQASVDYDIVYVRQPRHGDDVVTLWPEVFHPARMEAGADLVLLRPNGSEELLVRGGNGSVTDPFVSYDGEWVYFSYFYDLRNERLNAQRQKLPLDGADIFRIHIQSRRVEQLTFGEFTPNTAAGNWHEGNPVDPPKSYNRLGYGILNLGPCPLPGGKIAFTSNRNGFEPPKGYTSPTLQLFVMDEDGSNVTPIAPMNISSALHPTILRDGRLMYSSHESQGIRDRRNWGLWYISPDGRDWGPMVSAFREAQAFHFMTQLSNGDVVFEDYYNLNNNGFGALYRFPLPKSGSPAFFGAAIDSNPPIARTKTKGFSAPFRMPFTPKGLTSITPLTHADDAPAPTAPSGPAGKFTHPSGAPGNNLLVAHTAGPANHRGGLAGPAYDSGIYIVPDGRPVTDVSMLIEIKNDPRYNEAWPRAVVPYRAIHGVDEPAEIPWLPNDGTLHAELPAGTPHGIIGTSSFFKRETAPGVDKSRAFDGLEPFNTSANGANSNWHIQGADAGRYDNEDIWAVRILSMEPNSHRSYGPGEGRQFFSHAGERLRILGEIPLRKSDANGDEILDVEGNPDTSFVAKLPADTPFTFQTLDRNGLVLNMAQTWHQVRPGEMRVDCGGCHAHSKKPLLFEETAAARADYRPYDLSKVTPLVEPTGGRADVALEEGTVVNVEFMRDIRPILERSCTSCHTRNSPNPPADLVFDDRSSYDGLPGDYARLANDPKARWGIPPVIQGNRWRSPNASRYVRKFQSRRSLLTWKIFGERLDGWRNSDHPTESVPGVAATLPNGADPNKSDLDFDGVICPPPGSPHPLTTREKITFARWIDLGAPIDLAHSGADSYGWFLDDLKPTLTVDLPRPGVNIEPIDRLRIGTTDGYSGVDRSSLSLVASFPVAGRGPGSELADLVQESSDGVLEIALDAALPALERGRVTAEIRDQAGNLQRVERVFATAPNLAREYTVANLSLDSSGGVLLAKHSRGCTACGSDIRLARNDTKGDKRSAKKSRRAAQPRIDSEASARSTVRVASRRGKQHEARFASLRIQRQKAAGTQLFADGFARKNSDRLGPSWSERESESKVRLEDERVLFEPVDDAFRPMISGGFERQASGKLVWEFDMDFRRVGDERTYSFWMQLGEQAEMADVDPTADGVAINLVWGGPDQGLDSHEGLGYVSRGAVIQIAEVSGRQTVRVEADLTAKSYSVSVAGQSVADVPFNRDVPLDTVRFFAHKLNKKNFSGRLIDEVRILRDADGQRIARAAAAPAAP